MTFKIDRAGVDELIAALRTAGYDVIGPRAHDGAIVHDLIAEVDDLPVGLRAVQDGGAYSLQSRDDDALFGFTTGPTPWRRHLHPPRERLVAMPLDGSAFEGPSLDDTRRAFFGIRACDLAALGVYDRVMLDGPHRNARYASRREHLFIVAVQCAEATRVCFCASMGTGPRAEDGYDLALTELGGGGFVVEVGSDAGAELMTYVTSEAAVDEDVQRALAISSKVAASQEREMPKDARSRLREGAESSRWDAVATRCLSCGNCTHVCPTCFCTSTEDVVSLDGQRAERWERWDSCFSLHYSHLGEGSVRTSIASRYRNWLTHKLSTWHDQFGTSGCVGCGRCVTWCPVGIDLTEEVAALRPVEEEYVE